LLYVKVRHCRVRIVARRQQAGNNDIDPGLSFNIIFGINAGPAVEVTGSPAKPLIHSNLKHLYGVARVPCDTALREPIPARSSAYAWPGSGARDWKAAMPGSIIVYSFALKESDR